MPWASTETERDCTSSKTHRQLNDWMLPSKMMPTNSPARLTTGLPELPPMMSAVHTKLNGVEPLIAAFFPSHDFGRLNGGSFLCSAECSYVPDIVVNHG